MQEEEEGKEMKCKDVKTKEEHGSMEAGGSTLPNWGMLYPQKPYLCELCVPSPNWHPLKRCTVALCIAD